MAAAGRHYEEQAGSLTETFGFLGYPSSRRGHPPLSRLVPSVRTTPHLELSREIAQPSTTFGLVFAEPHPFDATPKVPGPIAQM